MARSSTLYILAGCSGAGKSTLLRLALAKKLPIFGAAADHEFQSTAIPSRFPESLLTFEDTLRERTWFQAIHLRQLSSLDPVPTTVVLHVDLVNVVVQLQNDLHCFGVAPRALQELIPIQREQLVDPSATRGVFTAWLSLGFFHRFQSVLVNTLERSEDPALRPHPPPDEPRGKRPVARDGRGRAQAWRHLFSRVFAGGPRPPSMAIPSLQQTLGIPPDRKDAVRQSLRAGWMEALLNLRPDLTISSQWRKNGLLMNLHDRRGASWRETLDFEKVV